MGCVSSCSANGVARRTVEDGIYQSSVETAAEHDGFKQEHPDRPCQDDDQELVQVFLLELDRRERIHSPFLSQLLRLALQHDGPVRFRYHQHERPRDACDDELQPVDPPPRHYSDKARSNWAQDGAPSRRSHEKRHSPATSFGGGVNVCVYPSNDGNGSTGADTNQEAHDNQA